MTIEDEIVVALRRIMRAVELHSRHLMEAHSLTGPQLATLQAIARTNGASTVMLARNVHLSSATLTGILTRLESRGLISRSRDQEDRRSVIARITPAGEQVLASAPSLLQDRFRRRLVKLQDWEQTMILAVLQRIASMMDVGTLDVAPMLSAELDLAGPEEPAVGTPEEKTESLSS